MAHICPNCGRSFESAFCPDCGTPAPNTPDETLVSPNPEDSSPVAPASTPPLQNGGANDTKKKKPIYKRPWFIVVIVLILLAAIGSAGGSKDGSSESSPTKENLTQATSSQEESVEKEPAQLVSISASYSGDTEAGTAIETGSSGIVVTGSYDDGTTSPLSGWNVENPGKLQAGTTSTFTISCEGMTCELDITCTSIDPEQYKESCVTYSYDELARNPDSYAGQDICLRGKVIQVIEESGAVTMRVNVTEGDYGIWDDTIMAYYEYSDGESRILEDDIITMYGVFGGLYTYESVLGASITVPLMYAEVVEVG